jgi:RNA polymerase sigma factor (sigma-70 family)
MPTTSTALRCAPDSSSLDLYLREIGRHRPLSAEEEVRLGQLMEAGRGAKVAMAAGGAVSPERRTELLAAIKTGEEATDRFVVSNLRLVVCVAKMHHSATQSLADAIADGNLGLLKAVERYDWRRGFKFSTYATWWIRQAISRGDTRSHRALTMSAHTDQQVRRLYRSRAELEEVLGRAPTIDELVRTTGLSDTLVIRYLMLGVPAISLDAPAPDQHQRSAIDVAADKVAGPLDELASKLAAQEVRRLLCRLDPRDRRILELRYGLGETTPHSYAEVAKLFGTTPGRIRQIETRIFSRLRRTTLGQGTHALLAS